MTVRRQPLARTAAKKTRVPVLRFRMRVTDGDHIAVGPGKIALLEAIASTGSITAAAKSLDMSYRRAWLLLDELNRSLAQPAVDSAKGGLQGGGSSLTEAGRQLITLYRRIEKRAEAACRDDIAELMNLLAR
ncbi:MAG TPA: LysR family transcriptional regulator [Burkholderiaceae bacterium]|nr:LysR family transcriptional regulator [Burkholderiaceae bacterium]